jgi:hypothetical protein
LAHNCITVYCYLLFNYCWMFWAEKIPSVKWLAVGWITGFDFQEKQWFFSWSRMAVGHTVLIPWIQRAVFAGDGSVEELKHAAHHSLQLVLRLRMLEVLLLCLICPCDIIHTNNFTFTWICWVFCLIVKKRCTCFKGLYFNDCWH